MQEFPLKKQVIETNETGSTGGVEQVPAFLDLIIAGKNIATG